MTGTVTRDVILQGASTALVERGAKYGEAGALFGRVAAVWSVRLGVAIAPSMAASLMGDLKRARADIGGFDPDHAVDAVGYEALAGELAAAEDAEVF